MSLKLFPTDGSVVSVCSPDSREGRLQNPSGIAVDPVSSNVYITDTNSKRVQIFSQEGTFIYTFPNDVAMSAPCGICIFEDRVFITQNPNHYIMVFKKNGSFICQFGKYGQELPGEFTHPYGLDIDRTNGDIYICDLLNDRIQIYTRDCYFKTMFSSKVTRRPHNIKIIDQQIYILNQNVSGDIQHICEDFLSVNTLCTNVSIPIDFEIDKRGNYLVLQYSKAQKFNLVSREGVMLRSVTVSGAYSMPRAIAVDNKGTVWVASKVK